MSLIEKICMGNGVVIFGIIAAAVIFLVLIGIAVAVEDYMENRNLESLLNLLKTINTIIKIW